jgi:hypothetical protein
VAENPAEKGAAKKAENAAEKGVGKENLVEKGEEKKMKEKAKNTAAERVATEGESDNDDAVVFHRPPADAVSGSGGDAGGYLLNKINQFNSKKI